jgi:beta-1,4-mannosyltransferase
VNGLSTQYRPPLRVLVHPHIDEANPYLRLLAEQMERENVRSMPFSWRGLLTTRPDVLHVHWPELAVGPRTTGKALIATTVFVATVCIARLRGVAVVWTLHNLQSHEGWHPRLEGFVRRWWLRRVDGALTLSRWAHREAVRRHARLSQVPFRVMPHGQYPAPATDGRATSRDQLGIRQHDRIALHFGHLRPYKGSDDLVRQFAASSLDVQLYVVGRARPPEYAHQLRRLARDDARIHLCLEQVDRAELDRLLAATDVVVLPYRHVTHAGSVLLALSAERPVVTTQQGAMPELREEVGEEWVALLDDGWDAAALEAAISWALRAGPAQRPPDLGGQRWSAVRRETRALYDEVLVRRRRAP